MQCVQKARTKGASEMETIVAKKSELRFSTGTMKLLEAITLTPMPRKTTKGH